MRNKPALSRAEKDLLRHGKGICTSDVFKSGFNQTHHYHTTVGDHTLNVTLTSLKMAYALQRHHVKIDMDRLVKGALCHDLGIIGRDEKYKNNRVCCHQHPIDSAAVARELLPTLDPKTENVIRRHMWPMTLLPPTNREAFIVDFADTYSTIRELRAGKDPEKAYLANARMRIKAYILNERT